MIFEDLGMYSPKKKVFVIFDTSTNKDICWVYTKPYINNEIYFGTVKLKHFYDYYQLKPKTIELLNDLLFKWELNNEQDYNKNINRLKNNEYYITLKSIYNYFDDLDVQHYLTHSEYTIKSGNTTLFSINLVTLEYFINEKKILLHYRQVDKLNDFKKLVEKMIVLAADQLLIELRNLRMNNIKN